MSDNQQLSINTLNTPKKDGINSPSSPLPNQVQHLMPSPIITRRTRTAST